MAQYRLQTLLEMRERAEEAAKQAFSEATRAAQQEKEKLEGMQAALVAKVAERKEKVAIYLKDLMTKGADAAAYANINRFEQRLKDEETQLKLEIERQKDVLKEAMDLVEKRRAEMAEAAKEKKAIEKHKASWTAEVKREREKREDLTQEEVGNTLHLIRSRKS